MLDISESRTSLTGALFFKITKIWVKGAFSDSLLGQVTTDRLPAQPALSAPLFADLYERKVSGPASCRSEY